MSRPRRLKELRPLILSVKARNWREHDDNSAAADTEFRAVRESVLKRDDNTCQFCGFRASSWQEVHHVNDDHADNRSENLVTICMFCHMVQHIGRAGATGEATLAFIPEITQAELHDTIRSCLVAMRWAEPYLNGSKPAPPSITQVARHVNDAAKSIRSKLQSRQAEAEKLFGTHQPVQLADMMIELSKMSPEAYESRDKFFHGIRLLPTGIRNQDGGDIMPKIIDSWMGTGGPFAQLSPSMWPGMFSSSSR